MAHRRCSPPLSNGGEDAKKRRLTQEKAQKKAVFDGLFLEFVRNGGIRVAPHPPDDHFHRIKPPDERVLRRVAPRQSC